MPSFERIRRSVNEALRASFGIHKQQVPDLRYYLFAMIANLDSNDVMAAGQAFECNRIIIRHEVADHENDAGMLHDPSSAIERAFQIGSLGLRLMAQNITDDTHDVLPALFRGHDQISSSGKKQHAHPVSGMDCRVGEHSRYFSGDFGLQLFIGAELSRAGHVNDQENRELSFFFILLDERVARSGTDFPVDVPDIITGHVLPVFGKLHPVPFEVTAVLSGHDIVHHLARGDLNHPDFFEKFIRKQFLGPHSWHVSRHFNAFENFFDELFAVNSICLGLKRNQNAMAKNIVGHRLDVFGGDKPPMMNEGIRPAGACQR